MCEPVLGGIFGGSAAGSAALAATGSAGLTAVDCVALPSAGSVFLGVLSEAKARRCQQHQNGQKHSHACVVSGNRPRLLSFESIRVESQACVARP